SRARRPAFAGRRCGPSSGAALRTGGEGGEGGVDGGPEATGVGLDTGEDVEPLHERNEHGGVAARLDPEGDLAVALGALQRLRHAAFELGEGIRDDGGRA